MGAQLASRVAPLFTMRDAIEVWTPLLFVEIGVIYKCRCYLEILLVFIDAAPLFAMRDAIEVLLPQVFIDAAAICRRRWYL